jgi:trimethylamine--corrinoid protein Co-methyltransferase
MNGDSPASSFRLLSDAQLQQIHDASLEILGRTGVRVCDADSLDLLQEAGCSVRNGNVVMFSAAVVEQAVDGAPSRITLGRRSGDARLDLEGHASFFGTGSDLPNTIDLETGERRPSMLSDVAATARLADALPNLDFVMSMALPSDVTRQTADRHSFLAMVANTSKPIVFTAWDATGLADIIAMAEIVAGGADALVQNPFVVAYLEPTSPLQHSETALRKLSMMVDKGLPFVYSPGPVEGATAPVTPAGSLAMANAEVLSGLTIAQLRRPGAPVIYGSGSGPLDMKTTVATYMSPEFMLHCKGIAELGQHFYKMPVWGFAGCSDSKRADMQAGVDSALWILWTALCGSNLVHDVGYVESGMTCSYEMIVICDEVIGFVRHLLKGIGISPETLALDVIDEVGPGGEYVTTEHTLQHYRECWYPRVFDRMSFPSWVDAGRPTAEGRARELARKLIAEHRPEPLSETTLETLEAIVATADERAGSG